MLEIRRSYDYQALNAAIRHPMIIDWVCDDGAGAEGLPDVYPGAVLILEALLDGESAGFFLYTPVNCVTCEVHTILLPNAWGKNAVEFAKLSGHWIFENTAYQRIITCVPGNNRRALNLALIAGMTHYGINTNSWLKDGVLYDLHLLGASKEG